MTAPDREPFPYTEDFRRAKRNSLIWSGITVAAALGSPAASGGPVTMGQTSFNLGFDQSVVIGLSGAVAIFMAIGFYQAMQRLRLHASNLFAGSTDVDRAFDRLSQAANMAAGDIDNISSRAVAMLEHIREVSADAGNWIESVRKRS